MAMANMNLIGVFVTKLWPVQALACGGGGGGDGDGGDGGATKTIISPKFSNFGDIITWVRNGMALGTKWYGTRAHGYEMTRNRRQQSLYVFNSIFNSIYFT